MMDYVIFVYDSLSMITVKFSYYMHICVRRHDSGTPSSLRRCR